MTTCKKCPAEVLWVTSEKGNPMPLNVPPERRIVVEDGVGRVVLTYESHFATCPFAKQFRKGKENADAGNQA